MNVDDFTQPLEAVMRAEREHVYPLPLKARDHKELFEEWCRLNPDALHEIELTALSIDARGLRVSTKYLIERQRYEGRSKLVPVTFHDDHGNPHTYGINNCITPCLARWLLKKYPGMNIQTKKSYFDKEFDHEA